MFLKQFLLLGGDRRKLQAERQVLFYSAIGTEQFFDVLVIVQPARLETSAQNVIYPGCHLVLDFVAQPDQKAQVIGCVLSIATWRHSDSVQAPSIYMHHAWFYRIHAVCRSAGNIDTNFLIAEIGVE